MDLSFNNQMFWENLLAGLAGNLLSGVLLGIAGLILIDQTKLRPWIYSWAQPFVIKTYQGVIGLFANKYVRVLIFLVALVFLNFSINKITASLVLIVIFWSFVIKQRFLKLTFPSSEFSDDFHELGDIKKNWKLKTGNFKLDCDKGKPKPSLLMELADPPQATNTLLISKDVKAEVGVIECEIFLSPHSLVNIVFFCDDKNDNWHMARFDTRNGVSDGFVIKDQGPGQNWRGNKWSGTSTSSGSWHKVRVEYNSERARMFRNGELLSEIENPQIFGKKIGLFNECGEVSVDNFSFSSR